LAPNFIKLTDHYCPPGRIFRKSGLFAGPLNGQLNPREGNLSLPPYRI
jgi:hypothetical protein